MSKDSRSGYEQHLREWLLTNGLGGYASGTLTGILTRRYHALLVAAYEAPLGRIVMFNSLQESISIGGFAPFTLNPVQPGQACGFFEQCSHLQEFRLESGLPVWDYRVQDTYIQKKIIMPYLQNTVMITYTILSSPADCTLMLSPLIQFRKHDHPLSTASLVPYTLSIRSGRYEIISQNPLLILRLFVYAPKKEFIIHDELITTAYHFIEAERGYDAMGTFWSPGIFNIHLQPGESTTVIGSTESWDSIMSHSPANALVLEHKRKKNLLNSSVKAAQQGIAAELVIAADQFIISPPFSKINTFCTKADGFETRSVIAGYHWFTDWGRDTMISLEGLTMITGRFEEAEWILKSFVKHIKNGLIPNLFPEGKSEGLYHTADATLWFFHALHRYLDYTKNMPVLYTLLDTLIEIIDYHIQGTDFGIKADPDDCLLTQGQKDYQLTWMDAKVDNWVVTPRSGKAVEINALWYNAVKLLSDWVFYKKGSSAAKSLEKLSEKIRHSFNCKFWYEKGQYLFDVVDGPLENDFSCRPNQILALSLDYPVLSEQRWKAVVTAVSEHLLTPFGLRTLSRNHPDYKSRYFGDLRSRDAAYHQGTVWAWLIGPFIDAWLRVYPHDFSGAKKFLQGFEPHLNEACIGSISEIFDAQEPYTPRGCIAQAWSVAEILRCIVKTNLTNTGI